VPVSRSELDRVIRRATELQFADGTDDVRELTEDEVLRIGREVGLDRAHMKRALGEVRAEAMVPALPADRGLMRRLIGEGRVRAERVVSGSVGTVEERLVRWLAEAESLHLVRRRAGISLWEPDAGWVAQLQRGLKWHGHQYDLAQARQLELSVQPMEEGFVLVTLTVDLRNIRAEVGGGFMAGFGFLGGGVGIAIAGVLMSPPAAVAGGVVGISAGILGGIGAGRGSFHGKEERARLAAEGLLDRLERGELTDPPRRRR
jgi:hypothetical protein